MKARRCGRKLFCLWFMALSTLITITGLLYSKLHHVASLSPNTHQSRRVLPSNGSFSPSTVIRTRALSHRSEESGNVSLYFYLEDSEQQSTSPVFNFIGRRLQNQRVCTLFPYNACADRFSSVISSEGGIFEMPFRAVRDDRKSGSHCSIILHDTDIPGGDFLDTPTDNPGSCCDQCHSTPKCTHWTFVSSSGICWLKADKAAQRKTKTGVPGIVSGIMGEDSNSRSLRLRPASTQSVEDAAGRYVQRLHNLRRRSRHTVHSLLQNGNWLDQAMIGNGRIGAMVGGTRDVEVIPLSVAGWFGFAKQSPRGKNRGGKNSFKGGATFQDSRAMFLRGDSASTLKTLKSLTSTNLGMYQYLVDISLWHSSELLVSANPNGDINTNTKGGRRGGNMQGRDRLKQLFLGALKKLTDESGPVLKSEHLISDGSLHMVRGTHESLHVQSHSFVGGNSSESWKTATMKEWFANHVDDVVVGRLRCDPLAGETLPPVQLEDCLHFALALDREPTSADFNNPKVQFNARESNSPEALESSTGKRSFDFEATLESSQQTLVPTAVVCGRLFCNGSRSDIAVHSSIVAESSSIVVCNRAKEALILISAEAEESLGVNPEQFATPNVDTLSNLRAKCWAKINRATAIGSAKLRRLHLEHHAAAMGKSDLLLSAPNSNRPFADTNSESTNVAVSEFGMPCKDTTTGTERMHDYDIGRIEKLHTYGRYLSLSAASKHVPTLQGLWADGALAEWNGDYHLNINHQMLHWLTGSLSRGQVEAFSPLKTFLQRLSIAGRAASRDMYGISQNSNAWVAHGFTDSSLQGMLFADMQWALCATCGAWAATSLIDVFTYSHRAILNESIVIETLRVLHGAAAFFEEYLFTIPSSNSDTLFTGPTTSPENSYHLNTSTAPNGRTEFLAISPAIDMSILRELANVYLLLARWGVRSHPKSETLLQFEKHGVQFRTLVSRLHALAMPVVKDSYVLEYPVTVPFNEGASITENTDPGHRHFSLLHWLYPASLLPWGSSKSVPSIPRDELYAAARKTLQRKRENHGGHTSWSAVWEAALWARLGDGDEAFRSLRHLFEFYLTDNFLSLHPPLAGVGPEDCETCYGDTRNRENSAAQKSSIPACMVDDGGVQQQQSKMQKKPRSARSNKRGLVTDQGDKFQLDGNLGYVAAVNEMLVQSHMPNTIHLLPALPTLWKPYGVLREIHLRGDTSVELMYWKGGHVMAAVLRFSSLAHPWWSKNGVVESETLPGFYDFDRQRDASSALDIEVNVVSPNELRVLRVEDASEKLVRRLGPLCAFEPLEATRVQFYSRKLHKAKLESVLEDPGVAECSVLLCSVELSYEACTKELLARQKRRIEDD